MPTGLELLQLKREYAQFSQLLDAIVLAQVGNNGHDSDNDDSVDFETQ
jgi:hypothetical protein